jgi:hypothetical protein
MLLHLGVHLTANCHCSPKNLVLTNKIQIQPHWDLYPQHGFRPIIHKFLQYANVKIEVCFPLWQVGHRFP